MKPETREAVFIGLNSLIIILLVYGLNLFNVQSMNPTVLLVLGAGVLMSQVLVTSKEWKAAAEKHMPMLLFATVVLLAWFIAAMSVIGTLAVLMTVGTLFSIMLLIPLVSMYIRRTFVKKG